MGQNCTKPCHVVQESDPDARVESPDPVMYDLMRKSIVATSKPGKRRPVGQQHLLYKHAKPGAPLQGLLQPDPMPKCPTRLLIRRRSLRVAEEGGGTHIYAIRYPSEEGTNNNSTNSSEQAPRQEQCPPRKAAPAMPALLDGDIFTTAAMASIPRQQVVDWVTVSEEHSIYIADVGLTPPQCDHIVSTTEQVCRGQYAAYTYAKQTLGCREYPVLAHTSFLPVHAVVHAISKKLEGERLQLDDREPHIVKYDVTKKERQKLDIHTDKSEWTFLIALSNGCGVDYEGGGTYFECLDATVHIQRGHALIFPGKIRHCGQKITNGLRFLLVGFLVDKTTGNISTPPTPATGIVCTGSTPVDHPPSNELSKPKQ